MSVAAEYRWEDDILIGHFTLPDDEGEVDQYLTKLHLPDALLVDRDELKQAIDAWIVLVDAPAVDAFCWELLAGQRMKTENGVLSFTMNPHDGNELRALATDWCHYSVLEPEETSRWVFSDVGQVLIDAQ